MTTRIYQGRIVAKSANFVNEEVNVDPMQALADTHRLFQDAVNYHLVALAGMAEDGSETIGGRFREQVKSIWDAHPKDVEAADTLSESLCRTLTEKKLSFADAVNAIYSGCERKDVLPFVLQYIIDTTQKGESVIQQKGRELLPKLCNHEFSGNFDFSKSSMDAADGREKLLAALSAEDAERYPALACEMDLSWAGVKIQVGKYWTEEETSAQVAKEMQALLAFLEKGGDAGTQKLEAEHSVSLYEEVGKIIAAGTPDCSKLLIKNNKAVPVLKQAAIFFMYYPCELSAMLLLSKIGKTKGNSAAKADGVYDYASLPDDPLVLARGERGFVYPGFSALPDWETSDRLMYSKEWDILAFKEALKILHGFELKTTERDAEYEKYSQTYRYMKNGEGKPYIEGAEEMDTEVVVPVLGGDERFELLEQLVEELRQDEGDHVYSVTRRALKCWEDVQKKLRENMGADEATLKALVREMQGEKEGSFGAQPLFDLLCNEKYRPIWQNDAQQGHLPRSKNILRDYCRLQEIEDKMVQLSRPVRITAAEANYSPRALTYSDLKKFGPSIKGCAFVPRKDGEVQLAVAVRNGKGRWQGEALLVNYSAPRMLRDELGVDAANWSGCSGDACMLVQPMMKALGIDALPVLEREPAVTLDVRSKDGCSCYLNFPVALDMEPLRKAIGKADIWKGQFVGVQNELLYMHWPSTYNGKNTPWWKRQEVVSNGYRVLGVDLGVRYAAAWSLIECNTHEQEISAKGKSMRGRVVGSDGERTWYGYIRKQGLLRLPGEPGGSNGEQPNYVRSASEQDIQDAVGLLSQISPSLVDDRLKDIPNILALNNRVLYAFRRLLSRYRRFLAFCYHMREEGKAASTLTKMEAYFSYNEVTKDFIPGIVDAIGEHNEERCHKLLMEETLRLRALIPSLAEKVAAMLLPRKRGSWKWIPMKVEGKIGSGVMQIVGNEPHKQKVYAAGGLSIARLSQLEEWRKCLQSMNRVLGETPGEKPVVGWQSRDMGVIDPCPALRTKIDNVREQRVNQIAHMIAAQALGLRLKPSRDGKNSDGRDIVHGEYETIPGRAPVDFVVMENLSRYLMKTERPRSENTTLMQWSHRQIAAKVQQILEEVFGIPVLFAQPAYTSRFDSLTSAPGFRAMAWNKVSDKDAAILDAPLVAAYRYVFDKLEKEPPVRGFSLYAPHPQNGGEFFISVHNGETSVRNADINASANIAWRGVAAPESIHLLHRVRMEKVKGDHVRPRRDNKREKALSAGSFHQILSTEVDGKYFGAFYVDDDCPDHLKLGIYQGSSLMAGLAMWSLVKRLRWCNCNCLNAELLRKIGMEDEAKKLDQAIADANDNIPLG